MMAVALTSTVLVSLGTSLPVVWGVFSAYLVAVG